MTKLAIIKILEELPSDLEITDFNLVKYQSTQVTSIWIQLLPKVVTV